MSLRGTRALFKRTMKYRRLFAFLMQSTMWLFHFKSLDIITPSIFAQSVTGSSFPSTSRGEKLWEIFLKSITISLQLSAFSCIRWDRDQPSTAVTACCTSLKEPRGMFGRLSYCPHTSTWESQPLDHWSWVRKAKGWAKSLEELRRGLDPPQRSSLRTTWRVGVDLSKSQSPRLWCCAAYRGHWS